MNDLKSAVRDHWEREPCGTRYPREARYRLEPYIPGFAGFEEAQGLDVLEVGVGAGTDFSSWCRHARHATGVDLTERSIELTRESLAREGFPDHRFTLRVADAESLPFPDASFDRVYSWGVLHHTPDTAAAFREAFRVLKPGGELRAMIYHVPSWTGLLLAVRYATSPKRAIRRHLESPGTKAYTLREARELLDATGFTAVDLATRLGPSDLLEIRPSSKYQGRIDRLLFGLYPRVVVRLFGDRFGLYLTIRARKAT